MYKDDHQGFIYNKEKQKTAYKFCSRVIDKLWRTHTDGEKAMAPHSSSLVWKIPWTEEPGRLQSMGLLRVGHTERLHFHFSLSCIGEGNGNPLQCSCLENPRDTGAWWDAIYGVAQSRTRLKRLSSSKENRHKKLGMPLIPKRSIGKIKLVNEQVYIYGKYAT